MKRILQSLSKKIYKGDIVTIGSVEYEVKNVTKGAVEVIYNRLNKNVSLAFIKGCVKKSRRITFAIEVKAWWDRANENELLIKFTTNGYKYQEKYK